MTRLSDKEVLNAIAPATKRNVLADRRDKTSFIGQLISEGKTLGDSVSIAYQLPNAEQMQQLKSKADNSSKGPYPSARMSEYERLLFKKKQLMMESARVLGIDLDD